MSNHEGKTGRCVMTKEQIREAVRHAIIEVQAIGPRMSATTFGALAVTAADRAADAIWSAMATDQIAAPVLSDHDRKVIGWIIEQDAPLHRGDLIRRTMERVLGLQPVAPVLSADDLGNLLRLRANEETARASLGYLSDSVVVQCDQTIALLDRILGGGR